LWPRILVLCTITALLSRILVIDCIIIIA
jgi:hypothetical protein